MHRIAILFICFTIACSGQKDSKPNSGLPTPNSREFYEQFSAFKLPKELDFCGERVPLEIPEVRERAEREFYSLLQQPGQVILYLKRAGRYFPIFEKLLTAAAVPDDLKYLSVAESALYMSRSPKGALGLWQFIPETGKRMGLIVDEYVDERMNPEKSTRAAIDYLRTGFDSNRTWTLAAAGYNMGHYGVADNITFQGKTDFYDLFLNEETSRYILRIVIIKEVMKNAQKYGFEVPEDEKYKPEQCEEVEVSGPVPDLAQWAGDHGSSYKDIKLNNPWILKRKLMAPPKGKTYFIKVPIKK